MSKGISSAEVLDASGARSLFERAAACFVSVLRVERAPAQLVQGLSLQRHLNLICAEVFTFLHRMTTIMGVAILPALAQIAELVIQSSTQHSSRSVRNLGEI